MDPYVLVLSCQYLCLFYSSSVFKYMLMLSLLEGEDSQGLIFFVACWQNASAGCRLKNLSLGLMCVMSVCVFLIIVTIFFPIYMAYVSLSLLHFSSVFSYPPLPSSLPHFLFFSPSVRTGYLQLWIQSTAPFSLAPHMETLRTWPLQVRLIGTCTFSILYATVNMFLKMAASDKQHSWTFSWVS